MTTFYLVRHAPTPETGRRLTGWAPGVHLSEDGRAQAEAVARTLKDVRFNAIYSSPIERTVETARAIAKHHGLEVQTRDAIGEVHFGRWTGRPLKALARTRLWSSVQRFPSGSRFPEGETLHEVQARAVAELEALRERHSRDTICIVSHADVIKLIAAHYLGVHLDLFQRIAISTGSVTIIAVTVDGPLVLAVNVPAAGVA